ncbi:beta strand repeat-containing protein, partial [Shewanella sp.]|uniref:beta strand repeat-containing protein n=1 Tax=Shewanella sp. TaxID=50422 RepID=UPI003568CAC9
DVVANDFTENSAAEGDVAATYTTFDEDGDALTVDFTPGTNDDGYYALVNGEVVLTQVGADLVNNGGTLPAVDLTVSDGSLTGQDSDTPVITLVNDAPESDSYSFSYNENSTDTTVIGTVTATDPEGTPVTYSIVSGNDQGWFEIDANTGVITLTPAGVAAVANDFEALANVHNLVVGASDGVNTTNIDVKLTELDVNEGPVINDYTDTINDTIANGTAVYNVNDANTENDTDVDGDTLTYSFMHSDGSNSLISEDGAFIINAQTGVISVYDTTQIDYENGSQIQLTVNTTDGSLSDTALVTFNLNNVDAIDDTPGTIYSASSSSTDVWTIPLDENGEPKFTISARNADGTTGEVNISSDNNKLGVDGSPRTSGQISEQIEYDSATGTSEAIVIDFNGLVNQATFSVANLFGDENSGEQGVWKAYYNGELVDTQTFTTGAGNTTGTFTINTGNLVFDQLVFEALPTISEQNGGPALADSSDYYLTSIDVTGPALVGTIITSESEILYVDTATEGLLANDVDAQGHDFALTAINGEDVTSGQTVTLASGALLTIYSDGTYTYNPNGVFDGLASGELTTDTFTYTVTDEYGATDTATVTVNIVGTNDLVSIDTPDSLEVFEAGLINGTNINAATETTGSMVINVKDGLDRITVQVDGNNTTLTLAVLMAASLTSPIIIAGEFGELSITGYNDGSLEYTYTLTSAQDHTGSNSETLTDAFQITAFDVDGDYASTTLNAIVHDDEPIAVNNTATLTVTQDSFAIIGGVEAEWKTITGGRNVSKFDGDVGSGGEDNDDALDQVRWGQTNGSKSGYGFIDNDDVLNGEVTLNQDIVLGTFTHYNYPISSGSSITAATMDVVFNIIDSFGNVTPVTLTLNFSHNETPNSGADPRDIVTVGNTNVTFNYEGDLYTIQVIGFKDDNGDVITSIYTDENASTSYELVIRMVAGSGYSLPSVEGDVLDNDITGADTSYVIGVAAGDQVSTNVTGNVGVSITGQYGTVIINNDGSYTYELTTTTDAIPSGAVDVFTYTISDADGDISSATLTVDVNVVNAQDVPVEDANNITTTGGSLNDTIIVVGGENGLNQKQVNVSFGGDLYGEITDVNGNSVTTNGSNLTSYSTDTTQVISGGSGSDHIETGRGGDIIYAGETGAFGYQSDDELELSIDTIANHHIMTGTLSGTDSIIDTDGLLLATDVASQQADVVNSGSGNDYIYGQSGSDILYGHTGNDYIDGGSHNDGLRGGAGNDTLIGGLGDDVLRGDAGNDTFKWQLGEFGNDIISDFNHTEDKIDLSDLLINEEYNNLENLLNFNHDANGSSVIEIDADGDGVFEQTITLDGVDLSSIYGSSEDGVIINGLLDDGALIVDTASTTTPDAQGVSPFVTNQDDGQVIP